MQIRHRDAAADTDAATTAVAAFLRERSSLRVARLGALLHPLDHPALLAIGDDGGLAGVLTYVVDRLSCEVLTVHTASQWHGTGTALISAVARHAAAAGCTRLWLVTTNDNVDALRFYQRRGFRLATLHPGAVDASRATLKPEIPLTGAYGIPLRDELVLIRSLA
ncbi:MAG TPA: GNAT family N-acetyltransferase [Pseudonocardiaceae bacterium]